VGAEGAVSEFPSNFHSVAAAIDRLFPVAEYPHLRCISEPGRYFAGPAVTIAAMVYGKRESESPVASAAAPEASSQSEEVAFKYWITDGVYGNLSNIIYDWAVPEAFPLRITMAAGGGGGGGDVFATKNERRHKSTVFGPTCDSVDVVMKGVDMPELQNGDWLLFTDNGAYSRSCANDFNGIAATACRTFYVWADKMEATWSDTTRQRSLITWEKPPLELHKLWDKVWSHSVL
jgi:ornithine decarboxylase